MTPQRFDPPIIGSSAGAERLRDLVLTLSASEVSVLITGESGVGKEVLAKNLHRFSKRKRAPFVSINCAALAPGILESELFGHDRGAFTGAVRAHAGLFEQANGGTLFLDEIGEMPSQIQAKLLRTLQEGEIRRLGEGGVRRVDVRLLSATNAEIREMVTVGSFRKDLFYRINIIEARIPPLRERTADLDELISHFYQALDRSPPTIEAGVRRALQSYPWPGNVRELQNELHRINALFQCPSRIELAMLSERICEPAPNAVTDERVMYDVPLASAVSYLEENILKKALIRTNWNKSKAARQLGLSRQGLLKKIERYGIRRETFGLVTDENSS